MKTSNVLLAVTVFCAAPAAAVAAELPLNPGLWETTMTRTNPMTGEPITETKSECVTETAFNPRSMMQGAEGCGLVEDSLDGDTLTFRMACDMEGSKAEVSGVFQSDGQTGKGKMDMAIDAGGMNMKMNMNWSARRLGDC